MRFAILSVLILLPSILWADRVALVVGNASYASVSPLDNPGNDSVAVAQMLERQGFDVTRADNLGRAAFYDALREFRRKADQSEFALFYYAGHGIEVAGENYLVPVDAVLEDERDASIEMISMSVILRQIGGASRLKMVVLDACRNNPFVARMKREDAGRSVGQGLANVSTTGADTLIAYAAAAGEITPDGRSGGNSPFTSAFLSAMDGPPADIRRVLGNVRDQMRRTVPGAAPFVYSSLGGAEYVLNPNSQASEPEAPKQALRPKTVDPLTQILPDFAQAERAGTLDGWNAFLDRYAALNYHVLYVLAQEKRDALNRTAALATRAAPVPTRPAPAEEVLKPDPPKLQQAVPRLANPAPQAAPPLVAAPQAAGTQPGAPNLAQPQLPEEQLAAVPNVSDAEAEAPQEAGTAPGLRLVTPVLDRDAQLRRLQTVLQDRNCYRGAIDGLWGRGSRRGLERLSSVMGDQGLAVDGETDAAGIARAVQRIESAPDAVCPAAVAKTPRRTPRRASNPKRNTVTKIIRLPKSQQPKKKPSSITRIIQVPKSQQPKPKGKTVTKIITLPRPSN